MTYRHAPEQQTHATASTPGTHNTPSCATSLTLKPSQPHALSFQTFNNSLRKDSFTGEGKIGLGGKSHLQVNDLRLVTFRKPSEVCGIVGVGGVCWNYYQIMYATNIFSEIAKGNSLIHHNSESKRNIAPPSVSMVAV